MKQSLPLKEPKRLSLLWARTLQNVEFFHISRNIVQTIDLVGVDNKYLLNHQAELIRLLDFYDDVETHKSSQSLRRMNITKRYNKCRDEITELVVGINYMLEGLKRSPLDSEVRAAEFVQFAVDKAGGSLSNQSRQDVVLWCDRMRFYISDDPRIQMAIDKLNLNRYFERVDLLGREMFDLQIKRGGSPGDKYLSVSVQDIRKDVYKVLQKIVNTLDFMIGFHGHDNQYLSLNRSLYYHFRVCNALSKRRTTIRKKKKLKEAEKDAQQLDMAQQKDVQQLDAIGADAKKVQTEQSADNGVSEKSYQQTTEELLEKLWAKEETLSIDEIVNDPIILELFATSPDQNVIKLLQKVVSREAERVGA